MQYPEIGKVYKCSHNGEILGKVVITDIITKKAFIKILAIKNTAEKGLLKNYNGHVIISSSFENFPVYFIEDDGEWVTYKFKATKLML